MSRLLRDSPRFSLNKIAEYMVAPPRRRRRLIIDQITKPTAIVITYEHARRALTRFFRDPGRTGKSLLITAAQMRDQAALNPDDHASKCIIASARALEAFVPVSERIRPKGVLALAGLIRNADITMSGVRVVIAPDVSLIELGTERRIGAIKFHFPRTPKLSVESLQYASTLMYRFLENAGDSPKKTHCYSVDVFSGRCENVPRAMKDRIKNVEAACEEIAERWPALYEILAEKNLIENAET